LLASTWWLAELLKGFAAGAVVIGENYAMAKAPLTRASLLVRIKDFADRQAWERFVELYAPLVYGFARKRGLQEADAGDLTQDVLRAVAAAAERLDYDPQRGTFRSWLYTVTCNKFHDFNRGRERLCQGSGDSAVQAVLNEQPARDDDQWEEEYRQRVFAWASDQIRNEFEEATWKAFHQVAVEGRSTRDTAAALGLSVGAVYIAKSRVLSRLREAVQEQTEE
jgi:RNA polymerase sigma factor (sigma-70 family)